jgi:hypothetical protein
VGGHAVFYTFDIGAADEDICSSELGLSGSERDDLVAFRSAL